jgi:hypothetical protein
MAMQACNIPFHLFTWASPLLRAKTSMNSMSIRITNSVLQGLIALGSSVCFGAYGWVGVATGVQMIAIRFPRGGIMHCARRSYSTHMLALRCQPYQQWRTQRVRASANGHGNGSGATNGSGNGSSGMPQLPKELEGG